MKKLICILVFVFCGMALWSQSMVNNCSFFTVTAADTIIITPADNIYDISISVPDGATDSTEVIGMAKTLSSGTVSQVVDGIKIAPGEYLNMSGDNMRMRYVYIIVRDEARIITHTPSRL